MYKIGFQQCTGFSLQLPQYSARLLLSRRCIEPETKKKHFGHYLLIFFQRDPVKTLVLHLIYPSSLSPVRSPIAVHSWDLWHRDVRPLAQPCIRRSLAGPEQILQKPVLSITFQMSVFCSKVPLAFMFSSHLSGGYPVEIHLKGDTIFTKHVYQRNHRQEC